jgi:hypothetical protein
VENLTLNRVDSLISGLAEYPDMAKAAKAISGKFKVVRLELPATKKSLRNSYHGLSVDPCDPETAAAEARNCPLVCDIGVTDAEDFECSYQGWVEHLRDATHRAAVEREQSGQDATQGRSVEAAGEGVSGVRRASCGKRSLRASSTV